MLPAALYRHESLNYLELIPNPEPGTDMSVIVSSHLNYTPNLLMSQSTSFCIIYFDLRMDRNPEAIRIKKTDYRTDYRWQNC